MTAAHIEPLRNYVKQLGQRQGVNETRLTALEQGHEAKTKDSLAPDSTPASRGPVPSRETGSNASDGLHPLAVTVANYLAGPWGVAGLLLAQGVGSYVLGRRSKKKDG